MALAQRREIDAAPVAEIARWGNRRVGLSPRSPKRAAPSKPQDELIANLMASPAEFEHLFARACARG